jgi:membrane-bound serine protease (ClpP class)
MHRRFPNLPFLAVLLSVVAAPAVPVVARAAEPAASAVPSADVIRVDKVISPIVLEQVTHAIASAEKNERAALVIELDTPGGLDASMRSIVQAILKSNVPVITWVAPEGSRAASAGLFIVTASHVAAMAPNTNLGAASPVAMGAPMDSTLKSKATNDAAAFIETLAKERGRNAAWNVRAVREAVAASEKEAVELGVVDFVARDVHELLAKADGRTVRVRSGELTLELTGATVHQIEPSLRHRVLSTLADPTVAYILFNLGTLGLVFELSNPGSILPGVIGAICLVLALIAFQTLPVNLGGVLLILLAMVFFLIELKVQSHGILASGGVLAFVAGSLLLFNPASGPAFRVSLGVIASTTIGVAAFFLFALGAGLRAQRRKPVTGAEGLVGGQGVAISDISGTQAGQVRVRGEIWSALAAAGAPPIRAGSAVQIVRLEGLTARVMPLETRDATAAVAMEAKAP